jgi:hypothetical protein
LSRPDVDKIGWFPVDVHTPDQLADGVAVIGRLRAAAGLTAPFDVAVGCEPDDDPRPWGAAGATWWMAAGFGAVPDPQLVGAVIDAGPPR